LVLALGLAGALVVRSRTQPAVSAKADVPTMDGSTVVLPRGFKERLGLKTAPVHVLPLTPVVKVAGTVSFDPRHVAAVGARLKGLVRNVARFEGDVVKRGDLLAQIDSPDLGAAQANVLVYRAQRHAAELNLKREEELVSRGLTTAREVEVSAATLEEYRSKLVAAERQVSALSGGEFPEHRTGTIGIHELRSPLGGTVVERNLNQGQSVEGDLVAFRVADLDHLWIELAVFERSIGSLHKGDRVEVTPLTNVADTIEGTVAYVGEQIDPATRTAAVRVEVDNRSRKLRPGQAVTAKIHLSGSHLQPVALVPNAAVTFVDGKPTVFVEESEFRLVATPVELGESDGTDQQVLSGLKEGKSVVVEGVFALKSELFR
jgi:cobalt-zinc-cadmium efflux system membrane fusion protein